MKFDWKWFIKLFRQNYDFYTMCQKYCLWIDLTLNRLIAASIFPSRLGHPRKCYDFFALPLLFLSKSGKFARTQDSKHFTQHVKDGCLLVFQGKIRINQFKEGFLVVILLKKTSVTEWIFIFNCYLKKRGILSGSWKKHAGLQYMALRGRPRWENEILGRVSNISSGKLRH